MKQGIRIVVLALVTSATGTMPLAQGLPPAVANDAPFRELEGMRTLGGTPSKPLLPTVKANARFPLRARMVTGQWSYSGNHEYKGEGTLSLVSASSKRYSFNYRCAYSFQIENKTYMARWITPDEKLEILMSKPGSNRTKPCRLSTTMLPNGQ